MRTIVAMAVLAGAAAPGWCQELPKPGPEHEWLKKHEGTWDVTMSMGGKDEKGSATYKTELGGFWLASTLECKVEGIAFTGKGLDGYCPIKKKYVSVWTDSMGPSPVVMTGDYDTAKKTLTMTGEGPSMEGKMTAYKSVTEYPDADTFKMSMWVGDGKEPMFTVAYKRKK